MRANFPIVLKVEADVALRNFSFRITARDRKLCGAAAKRSDLRGAEVLSLKYERASIAFETRQLNHRRVRNNLIVRIERRPRSAGEGVGTAEVVWRHALDSHVTQPSANFQEVPAVRPRSKVLQLRAILRGTG